MSTSNSSLFTPAHLFSLLSTKPAESFSALSSQRRQDVFLRSCVQLSQLYVATGHSSVIGLKAGYLIVANGHKYIISISKYYRLSSENVWHTTLSLVVSSLKSACCDFSIFSAVIGATTGGGDMSHQTFGYAGHVPLIFRVCSQFW